MTTDTDPDAEAIRVMADAIADATRHLPEVPAYRCATTTLAALREAGFVVVPREPTPEAVAAWWRIKNGHHFADEAPPTDTSDYAAYRALVRAAAGEPPR